MTETMTAKRNKLVGGAASAEALASSRSVLMPGRSGQAKGLQQVFTEMVVARFIGSIVGADPHQSFGVLDLTAGAGHLLEPYPEHLRVGIEIDADQELAASFQGRAYRSIVGDVQRVYPLLRSLCLSTGAFFPVVVANPPFSLDWEVPGLGKGSSTYLTMRMARKLLTDNGMGVLITGKERFERECRAELEPHLFALVEVEKLFPDVDLPCVIAFWRECKPVMPGIPIKVIKLKHFSELEGQEKRQHKIDVDRLAGQIHETHIRRFGSWYVFQGGPDDDTLKALREEYEIRRAARAGDAPDEKCPYLVRMRRGKMQVRLSAFAKIALQKMGHGTMRWLESFDKQPPTYFALQQKEWRTLLRIAEDTGLEVDPEVLAAVEATHATFRKAAVPMYPVRGVQLLGFLDDADSIECTVSDPERGYEAGKSYEVSCSTQVQTKVEEREAINQKTGDPEVQEVEIKRKAMDIRIGRHRFVESAADLEYILAHFRAPDPGDLDRAFPEKVKFWRRIVDRVEREIQAHLPSFRFKWFQKEDLIRGLVKGCFVLAWEQGLGKALGQAAFVRALELGGALVDGCALFSMPQDLARQFAAEVKRFFNRDVMMVGTLGRYVSRQQGGGFAAAMKRMDAGLWRSDTEVGELGGVAREGEVSAIEVKAAVWKRRRWCRARRIAQIRKEPFSQPEPPGVWAVTWYETLAVTGRIDKLMPERNEGMHLVRVRTDGVQHIVNADTMKELQRQLGKEKARAIVAQKFTTYPTSEFCPRCRADKDSGWDGRVCKARLYPLPDEKGQAKDSAVYAERRRVSGWATRRYFNGTWLKSEVAKRAGVDNVKYAQQAWVGRERCGHVDVELRRKPAYHLLRRTFRAVCVDEGTKIKGDDSLTSKAVRAIKARFKVVASGTPQKNFVVDLFWLLYWALGDSSPRFPYAYVNGRTRFMEDFAVIETLLEKPKKEGDPPKRGRVKVLPEVSNLLRLWKLLCSSVARRRMDEVGVVVALSGDWKCKDCGKAHQAAVRSPAWRGWKKPEVLECVGCGKVWDAIVPLTFKVVKSPWGVAQKKMHLSWLDERKFLEHFRRKHPNSPVWKLGEGMVARMAACLGQLAKLDYACTDPANEPDGDYTPRGISPWTPMRLQMLLDIEQAVRAGGKCLVGSCLVGVGPWVAERLKERGIRAAHITDEAGDGTVRTLSPKDRASILLDFRQGKYDVLCVGVQAVSLGHNLDIATDVFCDGFPWDFATWDQFLKRARRLSSMRPVTVHAYFPEGSLGHKKWEVIGDKTDASDLVLDGRIAARREIEVNKNKILQEMKEAGMRLKGYEVPEAEVLARWQKGPPPLPSFAPPRRRMLAVVPTPQPVPQRTEPAMTSPTTPSSAPPVTGGRRRVQRPQQTEGQGSLLPEMASLFRTIVVDPPWEEYGGGVRGAQAKYELQPYDQMPRIIMGSGLFLPYSDSHLYLWATNNFLKEALWLMEALKFRYVTKLTWVKTTDPKLLHELHQEDIRQGIGQYFRGEDEVLLFGVRGHGMDPSIYNERRDLGTVIVAPHVLGPDGRIVHSAKPPEAYSRIMARSKGRYLDVFARGAPRGPQWTNWGREALQVPVQTTAA
jgi:N6-adenosine-specific RNA methylase IME4